MYACLSSDKSYKVLRPSNLAIARMNLVTIFPHFEPNIVAASAGELTLLAAAKERVAQAYYPKRHNAMAKRFKHQVDMKSQPRPTSDSKSLGYILLFLTSEQFCRHLLSSNLMYDIQILKINCMPQLVAFGPVWKIVYIS